MTKLAFFGIVLILSGESPAEAEVIDRIVAVVDRKVITQSDVTLERLLIDSLGQTAPQDDRAVIEQIIDVRLLESDALADAHSGADPSDEAEIVNRVSDRKGFALETIRAAIRLRLTINNYIGEQFGAFALMESGETRTYYDEIFLPEARARGVNTIPAFEDIESVIYRNIRAEKMDKQVKIWLAQRKRSSAIEIFVK